MRQTIGILAHVDAGKTTFSEQILYHGGAIRKRGRVDHGDSFLDRDPIEKERGITIFSDQAAFSYGGADFTLVDTPGHVDFSSEMERAVSVLDMGIILVSAVEGVQGHTATIWRLLERYGVPTLFFINKADRVGADVEAVLRQMQRRLTHNLLNLTEGKLSLGMTEEVAARLAELDENLFEAYLENGYDRDKHEDTWMEALYQGIRTRDIFPVFSGSALLDINIKEFLEAISRIVSHAKASNEGPFSGLVYKVRRDSTGKQLAFLKVLSGRLRPRQEVEFLLPDAKIAHGKVHELRSYSGAKYVQLEQAEQGDLCAVVGLDQVNPGDGIGHELFHTAYETAPMLSARVIFDESVDNQTALSWFRSLEEEDPLLSVRWDEALGEIQVRIMGEIELDVMKELVRQRFHAHVEFGDCQILYKETVLEPVMGYGHFEPLRHYAEVHVRISPGKRGSGLTFVSLCPRDVLDENYQHLIRTHVMEREHKGVLLGAPLTDVEIALVTGRAHLKHTEGGDFREATYRAIRQGLEKAKSQILEPFYEVAIEVDASQIGRVIRDLTKMEASFEPPVIQDDRASFTGKGPVSSLISYPRDFAAFTGGRGSIQLTSAGYEPCLHPQEVISKVGYDKVRDIDHPSSSIFCAKGAGFTVPWDEAEQYMHCLK